MPLSKFLKASLQLFKKDVITFVIIRRFDLGILDDQLRYIAVKPNASISVLRQKVWHLLNLPDYCEEIILLKSNDTVIPLTDMRNGNDPQKPYILEVWLPTQRFQFTGAAPLPTLQLPPTKMLTIENGDALQTSLGQKSTGDVTYEATHPGYADTIHQTVSSANTSSTDTLSIITLRARDSFTLSNNMLSDCKKKLNLSCPISNSSLFRPNGKKSRENFANIFLKIQSDLSSLNTKLSNLESRIS